MRPVYFLSDFGLEDPYVAVVKAVLADKFKIDANRLQSDGKGWDRPVSRTTPDLNRRVEVQWFTVE